MSIERTLSIIKPDATKRNITGKIISCFEESGLNIIAQKKILLTKEQAEGFYSVHSEKPFFQDLVTFMTSAPIIVQVLEGENAILKNREIMGATNPDDAEEGTIRNLNATSMGENAVHGSDSDENAEIEGAFHFSEEEILS